VTPFVQIAVHPDGRLIALAEDGTLWQSAADGAGLVWVEMPTDRRVTDAALLDGRVVRAESASSP